MALSNWDYAAWNEKGEPIPTHIDCSGTIIELYKNWIYIRKKGQTGRPITVYHGEIETDHFYLYAERAPQDGIFVAVRDWKTERIFLGIGVYGWNEHWVGIKDKTREAFMEWLRSLPDKTINLIITEDEIPRRLE